MPKAFLGIGGGFLAINHLAVVLGDGVLPEALVCGCWLVLLGGWVLVARCTFDMVRAWTEQAGWRVFALILATLVVGIALAEAVAWFGYGQHLLG